MVEKGYNSIMRSDGHIVSSSRSRPKYYLYIRVIFSRHRERAVLLLVTRLPLWISEHT